jgi:prepilin-type N-terminal cleavage/methylation domain-containing protein
MKNFKQNSGFTLAEVLITLAIIGVVAALSIPVVIKNYKNTQTISQLKKTFSELKRVHEQILFENGGNDPYFDLGTYDAATISKNCDENWVPKLKTIKNVKTQ